jgi:hypothetical protein
VTAMTVTAWSGVVCGRDEAVHHNWRLALNSRRIQDYVSHIIMSSNVRIEGSASLFLLHESLFRIDKPRSLVFEGDDGGEMVNGRDAVVLFLP